MSKGKLTRREAIGKFKKAVLYVPPAVAIVAAAGEASGQTERKPGDGPPTEAKRKIPRKAKPGDGPPTEAKKRAKRKIPRKAKPGNGPPTEAKRKNIPRR